MTDLQLALLGLGALIILGVILFNWWQEKNLHKEAVGRFEAPQRDVLMDDFHIDTNAALVREDYADEQFSRPLVDRSTSGRQENEAVQSPQDDQSDYQEATAFKPELIKPAFKAPTFLADQKLPEPTFAERAVSQPEFSTEPVLPEREEHARPYQPQHAQIKHPVAEQTTASAFDSSAQAVAVDADASAAIAQAVAETSSPASVMPSAEADTEIYDGMPEDISHQIDLTAVLYLNQATTATVLREIMPALVGLDKPYYVYGLSADHDWHFLSPDHAGAENLAPAHLRQQPLNAIQLSNEYIRAAYSLQLADRSGALSAATLSQFQRAVDSIAYKLGAQVEWVGNPDPLTYALELDEFCIEVDKMVGFHIVQGPSGPFTGTKFRGLAEASGLVLGENGAFQYANENGVLYSLVNQENTPFTPNTLRSIALRGISFQLDIPRVKNCAEVFNQMVLAAKQMEHSLNATLVDDHQRALGESQLEKIRQQLKVIHTQMVARGVVPGSATALRLFS